MFSEATDVVRSYSGLQLNRIAKFFGLHSVGPPFHSRNLQKAMSGSTRRSVLRLSPVMSTYLLSREVKLSHPTTSSTHVMPLRRQNPEYINYPITEVDQHWVGMSLEGLGVQPAKKALTIIFWGVVSSKSLV